MQQSLNKMMNYITDTWPELFIIDIYNHNNNNSIPFENKGLDSLEFDNED